MAKITAKSAVRLLAVEDALDASIERALRARADLETTLNRILPEAARTLGAAEIRLRTRDESLAERTYVWRGRAQARGPRVKRTLDVGGEKVGWLEVRFRDPGPRAEAAALARLFAEELDAVLFTIHTANQKQQLIEHITRALTRRVFDEALDDAVRALAKVVGFDRLAVVHLDESGLNRRQLFYRLYRNGRCTHAGGGRAHRALDEAIAEDGIALLSPDRRRIARVLGLPQTVETLFFMGIREAECLGQLVVSTPNGLDALGRDLLRVFANAVTQRLIDYRRERLHLARHFSPDAVDRLLARADYRQALLAPRTETIGILYADINAFTRICERALKDPARIGTFVDLWAKEAVRIILAAGGVYDKMVGDCIIGLFGPPFFGASPRTCAKQALKAARELQKFTRALEQRPGYRGVAKAAGLPGFGVAVGLNVCPAVVGLFGATKSYTAFSSGMNQTARLQSLGGFREILAMDSVRKAVGGRGWSRARTAKVKNVAKPLRYHAWEGD